MRTDVTFGARSFEGFAFGPSFEAEVERILQPLHDMRVRVSLFSVKVGSLDRMQTLALTHHAFTRMIGPTGPLSNGDAGVLYVGPRPDGANGDQKLERWMVDELRLTVFRNPEFHAATSVDLSAVHRCLDEVGSARDILDELAWGQTICRRCVPLQLQLDAV